MTFFCASGTTFPLSYFTCRAAVQHFLARRLNRLRILKTVT